MGKDLLVHMAEEWVGTATSLWGSAGILNSFSKPSEPSLFLSYVNGAQTHSVIHT